MRKLYLCKWSCNRAAARICFMPRTFRALTQQNAPAACPSCLLWTSNAQALIPGIRDRLRSKASDTPRRRREARDSHELESESRFDREPKEPLGTMGLPAPCGLAALRPACARLHARCTHVRGLRSTCISAFRPCRGEAQAKAVNARRGVVNRKNSARHLDGTVTTRQLAGHKCFTVLAVHCQMDAKVSTLRSCFQVVSFDLRKCLSA